MTLPSQRDPQLEPSDHCYVVLQDHGLENGGWGPAALTLPPAINSPAPIVYTGSDKLVIDGLAGACRYLAQATGKATILARFTVREDVARFEDSE